MKNTNNSTSDNEIIKVMTYAAKEKPLQTETIGDLLSIELMDSAIFNAFNTAGKSKFTFEELQAFVIKYGIKEEDTFEEALEKIKDSAKWLN